MERGKHEAAKNSPSNTVSRPVAERVAIWASALNMSPTQIVELAITRWEQLTPCDALGIEGGRDASHLPRP